MEAKVIRDVEVPEFWGKGMGDPRQLRIEAAGFSAM
jgi:hypothetical protein